jgi:hypothetical protein
MGVFDVHMAYATVIVLHLHQLAPLHASHVLQRQVWQNSAAFKHDFAFIKEECVRNIAQVVKRWSKEGACADSKRISKEIGKAVDQFRAWRDQFEIERLNLGFNSASVTLSDPLYLFLPTMYRNVKVPILDVDTAHLRWEMLKTRHNDPPKVDTRREALTVYLGGWEDASWNFQIHEQGAKALESDGSWIAVNQVLYAIMYVSFLSLLWFSN